MSDTHPLPPPLEQDPKHYEFIPQDQVDQLNSTIEELTEKLQELQIQVGVRSTTGEMTAPFTPSLKVAKTMERLRQPPIIRSSPCNPAIYIHTCSNHQNTPSGVTKV